MWGRRLILDYSARARGGAVRAEDAIREFCENLVESIAMVVERHFSSKSILRTPGSRRFTRRGAS